MTSDKISEARQTFLGCVYRNAQSSPCEIGRLFARKATDQKELTTEVVKLMESAFTVAMAESKDLRMQLAEERLRADTAEAERAKANEKIDRAWNQNCAPDHKACIPGALDAWKRPVLQYLPYDFSGNPGASATQYCNGWNDAGGYWKAHATEVEEKLAAAEQRIAEQNSLLEEMATEMTLAISDSQIRSAMTVIGRTRFLQILQAHNARIDAALNPNPEAESHE